MRKIIVQDSISVDGFFAGPHGEIDWHVVDADFNQYARATLDGADLLLFGRITYDLMVGYWPTEEVIQDDPLIAGPMNSIAKIVFSKDMKEPTWNNTSLRHDIDANEVKKIKEAPGKDILVFGSGTIVSALTKLGLIDEYRFIVTPVILGVGRTLFESNPTKLTLKLIEAQSFASGNVLLRYGVKR